MSILFSLLKPWVIDGVKTHFSRHPFLMTALVGTFTFAFAYLMLFRKTMRKDRLRSIQENKQKLQKEQFEILRKKHRVTQETSKIANLGWDELVNQLQSRKLTAVKVLESYIAKSLEVTTFSNAVTEYYTKAHDIASMLDKLPKVKGPLHGIPFCVKDDTDLEGMDSTLGFAKNCFQPKEKSSGLVATLMDLGAVPFCKTNVPQTLLNYASDNPIFGTTTSSHNNKLGPGGSSSGTGALVGGRGALFGTGTDIGGSLRIPAHFNGVSSLKPTAGRLSMSGISATLPNIMGLEATSGIIGANARVVAAVYKNLLTDNVQTKFDQLLAPIPWNTQLYSSKKKLRIGYFTQVPFFPPIGDTVEVVEEAKRVLTSQGHTLVPMTLPDGARIMRCAANFLMADEYRQLVEMWKGEEIAKCTKLNHLAIKVPFWLTRFVTFLMKQKFVYGLYSPSLASIADSGSFKSFQMWSNNGEKKKLTEEILAIWNKLELDCCLCPVMPFPALPVDSPGLLPVGAAYTMPWNVVNFPAGVVRFGRESGKNIEKFNNRGDQSFKIAQKGCKESIGSPIGVQVVGLPFKDELVLRIMEDLDDYASKRIQ